MLKTHSCGELNKANIGQKVTLAGWVDRRRDHGGLTFIDLRDREGLVQVVFNPETSAECHAIAEGMRNEFVVRVEGEVAARPEGTENLKLPTGEIEIIATTTEILNASKTPPFYINEDIEVDENLRLKYRYLDLRRERMQKNLILRHRAVKFFRDFLDARGFIEVETPILIKSSPEGARDYLVPSRVHPGSFYALPQSPQQMKQLLMVAGMEKYFQIARCFRDEDTRADRQPEHTQLDIEMSFVEAEDILSLMEEMFIELVETIRPDMKITKPFPRIDYADAMEKYGNDKPDLRFGLQLNDISDIAEKTGFGVFRTALGNGGRVKALCAPGCAGYSRKELEELNKLARGLGAAGVLTIALEESAGDLSELSEESIKSVAAKYLTVEQVKQIAERTGAGAGDLMLIMAGNIDMVNMVLSELRMEMGRRLGLIDPDVFAFAFVLNFPLFTWDDKLGRWDATHHAFTAPRDEDIPLLESDPGKAISKHFDIVCNGTELSSGSIRIHNRDLQNRIFRLLGYTDEDAEARFGTLLEAFEYGAPPHGGIAPGIDRTVMLLAGEETIREVIAFPKNQSATDLTFGAPSPVTMEQLDELHISLHDIEE